MRKVIMALVAVVVMIMVSGCGPWGAGGGEQRWWIKTWPRGGHCSTVGDEGVEICLK